MAIDPKISDPHACCQPEAKTKTFWKNKLFITSTVIVLSLIAGQFVPILKPLQKNLLGYLQLIAIPILIGLFIGGAIDWLVPGEYISKLLANRGKRSIFYAVCSGFIMTACSHGILAIAIQLYKKGASAPAVVAFLLASPWANLPLTILIVGFFGLPGLIFVVSAIVIALTTGLIFTVLEKHNLVESNPNTVQTAETFSIIADIKMRFHRAKFDATLFKDGIKGIVGGGASLADMVLWWILIGITISSIVGAYIPTMWMEKYMGASFLGLLVTLALATVMEICSEGTAPLAFEIYRKTAAMGNSFVFLMAGVVTDYTEIGLLWTNVGKKTAIWMPIIAVPQVVALGLLYNYIF